jgi:ATP-binding cassette subfamily F protein 3
MLSKEVLKQALLKYDGAMIVVSHDRDFLDTLTDKVIAFRQGQLIEYVGDIDVYIQSLSQTPASAAKGMSVTAAPVPVPAPSLPPVEKVKKQGGHNVEKERKRIEKRITEIETATSVLEKKQQDIELQLAQPELYKDPVTQKRLMSEYEDVKREVSTLTDEWESCQEQLEGATT